MNDLIKQQAAWDDFAEEYYATEQASQLPYVTDVLSYLQQAQLLPQQLLDLGSGAGRFTLPFAQAGVRVTAVDFSKEMLAILRKRAIQQNLTHLIITKKASWQQLVQESQNIPALWISMLPDITAQQMLQISRLVTEKLLLFRLTQVNDPLLTPLLAKVALPPERPEIQSELMVQYQTILQSEFQHSQTQFFNYQLTEELSETELWAYLRDYPEITSEKFEWLQTKIKPKLNQGRLKSVLDYRFELLILER